MPLAGVFVAFLAINNIAKNNLKIKNGVTNQPASPHFLSAKSLVSAFSQRLF